LGGTLPPETIRSVVGEASATALRRTRAATATTDGSDLDRVLVARALGGPSLADESFAHADEWRDAGVWLLFIPLLLAPLAFRRGWLVAAALCWALAPSSRADASTWTDLWQRRDQQGAAALAEGRSDQAAGLFDISHMGQLVATGPRAGAWLNTMLTNNLAKLEVGAGQYTFLLNDNAGIIDDLIAYRIEDEKFLLVVNASRIDDDFSWLQSHLPGSPAPGSADVQFEDQSDRYAGLAIQGPRVDELFRNLFGKEKELPARNRRRVYTLVC